jgi:hypothetical protein
VAQLTIYLDDAAERRVRAAARKSRVWVSRWVAELTESRTRADWAPEVRELAGVWPDFPGLQEVRPGAPKGHKIVAGGSAPGTLTQKPTRP